MAGIGYRYSLFVCTPCPACAVLKIKGQGVAADKLDKWIERATRLGPMPAPIGPQQVTLLAERLVRLDALLRSAPTKALNSYTRLKEAEVAAAAETRRAGLELEQWDWSIERQLDPKETIRPLAIEIRATDAYLRQARSKHRVTKPNRDWKYPQVKSFVIPCRERRLGKDGTRDRQPYERRGILQHRILPTRIGNFQIRLSGRSHVADKAEVGPPRFKGGAALFTNLHLDADRSKPGLFTVRSCRAPDHDEQILACLIDAHDTTCTGLVWPELTIAVDDRRRIADWLAVRQKGEHAHAPLLGLVVAGSWHETKSGKTVNRSLVVDGLGNRLLTFDKLLAYQDIEYGTEDIEESDWLEVLVVEETLVAFGICRDFAEIQPSNPFAQLDVDFVIVPSMGNATTADGHRLTAAIVARRFATQSFIVQQADPGTTSPLGFVVHDRQEVRQNARFQAYETSTSST